MIIDLQKFVQSERRHWAELESFLDKLENDPGFQLGLESLKRFHYLYERTSADLAKITTFASEPETRRYLESLVARAYKGGGPGSPSNSTTETSSRVPATAMMP